MLVASIRVETRPGAARAVAARMEGVKGMGPVATEGDHCVTAMWRVPEGEEPESLSEVLQAMNPEILEVFPTVLGPDDGDDPQSP